PASGAAPPSTEATAERFNLIVPRSRCPSCKAPITALQNIPIVSWLFLKGRCASCGAAISIRYPLVEGLCGLASALAAWKLGFGWRALAGLVRTWYLIALMFIGLDHQLLPDNMSLPLVWLGVLLRRWGSAPAGGPPPVGTRSSITGAVAGYLCLWSVYHVFRL